MFLKILVLFFFTLSFCSCNISDRNKDENKLVIDTTTINRFISNKKIDTAIQLFDKELNYFKVNKKGYLDYNNWFINCMAKNEIEWEKHKKYYLNICANYNLENLDSNSKKIIAKSFYMWARLSFRNEGRTDDSVLVFFEKATELNKKFKCLLQNEQIYAYKILGILYNQIGDTKKSMNYYNLESTFIDTTNKIWVATNIINKAIALNEMGLFDSAANIINAVVINTALPPLKRVSLYNTLSESQTLQKKYHEAQKSIDKSIKILDTITNYTSEVEEKKSQALKQKGILERLFNKNNESINSLQQAIAHYKATGSSASRDLAKIYIQLGKSFHATAQYDSALKYYQIALKKVIKVDSANYLSMPLKEHLYAENTIMEALDAKAITLEKIYEQNHQQIFLETAVQCYDIVSIVEKQLLQNFSYDESRLIMLKENRIRSEKAIAICFKLFELSGNNYWSQQAFQFAENSKAFVLLESIKRNIQSNSSLQNDTLYEKVQALQTRLAYADKLIFENTDTKTDSSKKELLSLKSKLNEQLLLANNEFKLSSSNYKAFANNIDTSNVIEKASSLVDDKTAIVEFFTGDSANYIFIFTQKNGVVFLKAQNSFIQNLKSYVSFFTDKNKINNAPAAYQSAAHNFYNEIGLVKNISSDISSIIMITDGSVNYIPFEALVTKVVKDLSPKDFSYLLYSKKISYGYSIATLLAQANSNAMPAKNIYCYAPVFSNNECGKQPLLYSEGELDAIKSFYPKGNYFLSNNATLNQFKNTVEAADIVHIATHANADTSAGMQSSINFIDSALYLNEVYNLHLKANLVVLSACETNIGIIDKSEGTMSLARGFYYAGARNVVTSLWNVNDKSTSMLFNNFYKDFKNNNYIEALRNAKLSYLKNYSSNLSSPYYWASFIHIGYSKHQNYPVVFIAFLCISNFIVLFVLLRNILLNKF